MATEQLRNRVLQRADGELSGAALAALVRAFDGAGEVPGPEQLVAVMSRLDTESRVVREQAAALAQARDDLRRRLTVTGGSRAAVIAALIAKDEPDLDGAAELADTGVPAPWHRAATLVAPEASDVERACATVRSAMIIRADAERSADALAADRVQFLETSIEFHDRHGTQPCPVCAEGVLDDEWVVRARAALTAEQEAAGALRVARSQAHRARQTLAALVRAVEPPPAEDAELTAVTAARRAYETFSALPVDDDAALVDHVERALPPLHATYRALRAEASGLIGDLDDDAWQPVALALAVWLEAAKAAAALRAVTEAAMWLRENGAPLQERAQLPPENSAGNPSIPA